MKLLRKTVLIMFLVIGITLGMMPAMTQAAYADVISYRYCKVDSNNTVHRYYGTCPSDYTLLKDNSKSNVQLGDGWYVVWPDTTLTKCLQVTGDAKLIIYDSFTLNCNDGIYIKEGCTLTVYPGTSSGSGEVYGTGKIVAKADGSGPGIGGAKNTKGGNLVIHGCTIDATGETNSAGIGGGEGSSSGFGDVTIYYGTVNAKGGSSGAGIGRGEHNDSFGTVKIYGGTVNASSTKYGAGIGGGESREGVTTKIYGGTVNATGGHDGAGIGGGESGNGGNLTIEGGTVTATGGNYGAGIGGGEHGNGGTVTIKGGTVTATGGKTSAGIGGGKGDSGGNGGTVTIEGGTVNATGGQDGAGIGGGDNGEEGTTKIQGGTVTAQAGNNADDNKAAQAIGHGQNDTFNDNSKTDLNNSIMVTAGNSSSASSRYAASNRKSGCRKVYAKTEECSHPDNSYTSTESTHTRTCKYCKTSFSAENHSMDSSNHCTVCGYQGALYTVSFNDGGGSGSMESVTGLLPNSEYTLPVPTYGAPTNKAFKDWKVKIGDGEDQYLLPESTITVTADTTVTANWSDNCTVTFKAGEGSGSKEQQLVAVGSKYTFPDPDGLNAPQGKAFKYWSVKLNQDSSDLGNKKPGETIENVPGHMTATAVWDVHNHSFAYSASDNTITASCTNTDTVCPLEDNSVSLKIVAPTLDTYGGSGAATAKLDGDSNFNTVTGNSVSESNITYVGIDDTTYEESATAPTGAGRYSAKITVEGKTASVDYKIGKAPLTVTAKDKTITYGDAPDNDGVVYQGFVKEEDKSVLGGELSYDYSYTQYGDVGSDYTITPGGLTSGNYDITFADGKQTVEPKEVGLEWGETELVYNGSPQVPSASATETVNGDKIGVEVSAEGEHTNVGSYTAVATALTGSKKDNYKLPADGLTTGFSIIKANPSYASEPKTVEDLTADSSPQELMAPGTADGGDIYYATGYGETLRELMDQKEPEKGISDPWSVNTPTGTDAGYYVIWYYIKGDANHNDSEETSWQVNAIQGGDPEGSGVPIYKLPKQNTGQVYTGEPLKLMSDPSDVPEGVDFTYCCMETPDEPGDDKFSTEEPTATNAGTYYVWFKVEGEEIDQLNFPKVGPIPISIGKADAMTLEDVSVQQSYKSTDVKASVAGLMPKDAGKLTYAAGEAQAPEHVTVSGFAVDDQGTVAATLSGGQKGDTITLPVTIGSTNYKDSQTKVRVELTEDQTEEYEAAKAKAEAKKVTLRSAKAKKGRKAVVKWKKASDVSGYVIAYSTSKKFTKKTTKKVTAGAKATKKTLKKLKAGKKYYVKMRACTLVENPATGENEKICGKWSKVKKFKARK